MLADAQFDLPLLDELAVDVRAYDHGHPVNRRPNYVFGEWDPHHLDNNGRYRRYVVRKITLDALLDRVSQAEPGTTDERLTEAAAVLAGTILMAAGVSGSVPGALDSSISLATLLPRAARYRDAFMRHNCWASRTFRPPTPQRLRQEQALDAAAIWRRPGQQSASTPGAPSMPAVAAALPVGRFTRPWAIQGASRVESRRSWTSVGVRPIAQPPFLGQLTSGQLEVERGRLAGAARQLLPEIEELLHRASPAAPLPIPGTSSAFRGSFPLSPAREVIVFARSAAG